MSSMKQVLKIHNDYLNRKYNHEIRVSVFIPWKKAEDHCNYSLGAFRNIYENDKYKHEIT